MPVGRRQDSVRGTVSFGVRLNQTPAAVFGLKGGSSRSPAAARGR